MNDIDKYIKEYPDKEKVKLLEIRKIIKESAPMAEEKMSWKMPTYYLNGNLVQFAMHKTHIGFYPGPSGVEAFKDRLEDYKYSKGAIQFPLEKEVPRQLIIDIVKFRVKENQREEDIKKQEE